MNHTGKTLYFEGAGTFGDKFGELGNCRIRTAFTAGNGKRVYLELGGATLSKQQRKHMPDCQRLVDENPTACGHYGWVDSCHWLTDDPDEDDENCNRVEGVQHMRIPWTHEGILRFVNERIGARFDAVEVLPALAGYRVFGGKGRHNTADYCAYGDEFEYDEESTMRAETIYEEEVQRQRDEGEKFPCVSAWRDIDDPMLLHVIHFGRRKRNGIKLEDFDVRLDG